MFVYLFIMDANKFLTCRALLNPRPMTMMIALLILFICLSVLPLAGILFWIHIDLRMRNGQKLCMLIKIYSCCMIKITHTHKNIFA